MIGHRGAAGAAPENTLASIRKARELGASWIEFDVKLTKDGQAILFHDDCLERTTDGRGAVAATTLAEIRRLDAELVRRAAFRGEPVPTLEALALCAELGLGINVEIKPCAAREWRRRRWRVDAARPVAAGPAGAIGLQLRRPCVRPSRAMAPELPRGYLAGTLPRGGGADGAVRLHHDAPQSPPEPRGSGRRSGRRHSRGAVYGQ